MTRKPRETLFEAAAARNVVPVREHHDGISLYASSYTNWDDSEVGTSLLG